MHNVYYSGYGTFLADNLYSLLLIPVLLFSLWAQFHVSGSFRKYSGSRNRRGITGARAAQAVLQAHGVRDVAVRSVPGNLTDHYDPRDNTIYLSEGVYGAATIAAVGVAAHEAGHAVQYAKQYFPMKVRAAIIPATNIGSRLAMPLILLGVLFGVGGSYSYTLVYAGIACFSLSLVFQLVTLPVEFNASRRAMQAIKVSSILTVQEQKGARKTLTAAAMTYVAAVAVAAAQLLRLILLFGGRRRSD